MNDPRRRPRLQRAVVLLSVFAVVLAASLTVGLDRQGTPANAALPDSPFSCGSSDQNRQAVPMWAGNSGNDNASGVMRPCLSGVGITLNIPSQSNAATINDMRKLSDLGGTTIKTANGGLITNAYHIAFKNFTVNPAASGVTLATTSGTAPATPHSLTLAPDNGLTLGGSGVITDLLVDGDSVIVIELGFFLALACGAVGGSGGSTCTVQVKNVSGSFVALAAAFGIDTFTISRMSLKVYYLVSHTAAGGIPAAASLQ